MIRTLILSAVASVALTGVAFAGDPMEARIGNTIKSTNAKGEVSKLWYAADGTFTGENMQGEIKGTWKLEEGKICLTQTEPAPEAGAPTNQCNELKEVAVGDKWSIGEGDAKLDLELLAGKQ
jgi:hypothetical protein